MGKVKGDEKKVPPNEVLNKKRKRRKKELDILRRNVLEAKRKLREKTAPPKIHDSTFNKILNSFADRRQENDNKTQGFDSKGRRSGLKKMCNRLLPSRKPQVGIFANGSKGAEIKRVNLSLNESDRARFEGDLQKVLGDGSQKCKVSTSHALNKSLHRPSTEKTNMEERVSARIPDENVERKPLENGVTERCSGKRKLELPPELEKETVKKAHSELENMKIDVRCAKGESEWKTLQDKRWKRSLFQNEEDDFEPVPEPGVEQLRFSPTIGKAKIRAAPSGLNTLIETTRERLANKRLNFNYGQLGQMAAARYEELCAIVCAENFDTCLQDIPHIDPLEKVKQSLINVYAEACNQKASRSRFNLFADESLSSSSHLIHSNIHKNKYFDEDAYQERQKLDTANASKPRGVCQGSDNPKNFPDRKTTESYSSVERKPAITKTSEVKNAKNIPSVKKRGPSSSEASITEQTRSSLKVNYDSSRKRPRSDIVEFLKTDGQTGSSFEDLNSDSLRPRLAGIPSDRKKTMLRYLKEVNNLETAKEQGSIYPGVSAGSAEDYDVQKSYLGDPSRRHEMRTKRSRNAPERRLNEMRSHHPYEANIEGPTRNSLDVKCDGVGTCSGMNLGEFPIIYERAHRPAVVNLGSATRSTLAKIPSDRGEFMVEYLQGVNNKETREEDRVLTFPEEGFVLVPEDDDDLEKRYLLDPPRRHRMTNTEVNRRGKTERHVPAILRKSQATKRNRKSNTAGTVLDRGAPEFGNVKWKTLNCNADKLASESAAAPINSFFDERETFGKPSSTEECPFSADLDDSDNPERLGLRKNTSGLGSLGAQLQTSAVVNALYDPNKHPFKTERHFMDNRFSYESAIGQKNTGDRSGAANFAGGFKLRSPKIYGRKSSTDNVGLLNFHDSQQSRNLPIFSQQQRPDGRERNGAVCGEKEMRFLGDHESQRFPVFLKRKTPSSTETRKRYEGEHSGWLFPDIGKPKVIIIKNPTVRGNREDFRRGMNGSDTRYKNDLQNINKNYNAALAFSKFPQGVQVQPVQVQNFRQNMQQFQVPRDPFQNVGHQAEQLQMPQCLHKIELQNPQQVQIPSIMYQNVMRNVVDHKQSVQELGNDSMSFFEPTTFGVQTSQRMFQNDASSSTRIPAPCASGYFADTNLNRQGNCCTIKGVQFGDRRTTGFVLAKNEPDLFCHDAIDLPKSTDQIPHRQNYSPIISREKNHNYQYNIDPRCPQAGYQWNQIDQSGAQVHQRVIQPVYNVIDAYCPQVPRTYFNNDT